MKHKKILKRATLETDGILSGIIQYAENTNLGIQEQIGVLPSSIQTDDGILLTGLQIFNPVLCSPGEHCTLFFFDDFAEKLAIVFRSKNSCTSIEIQELMETLEPVSAERIEKRIKLTASLKTLEKLMAKIIENLYGERREDYVSNAQYHGNRQTSRDHKRKF